MVMIIFPVKFSHQFEKVINQTYTSSVEIFSVKFNQRNITIFILFPTSSSHTLNILLLTNTSK